MFNAMYSVVFDVLTKGLGGLLTSDPIITHFHWYIIIHMSPSNLDEHTTCSPRDMNKKICYMIPYLDLSALHCGKSYS